MGRMQAEEMKEFLDLDTVLQWHLKGNHYPPISTVFIPVAKLAIELAQNDEWETVIIMPNNISLTVSQIIKQLHLDSFLD